VAEEVAGRRVVEAVSSVGLGRLVGLEGLLVVQVEGRSSRWRLSQSPPLPSH